MKFSQIIATTACLGLAAAQPLAAERFGADQRAYIENNLLSIFYHEFGHALVDVLELPIFGQEEDAADVLSVFLIDAFFEEETAVAIAEDSAFGFLEDSESNPDVAYWDVHGPDLQRYYNLVCLFYGANPAERAAMAQEMDLPPERAETCEEEYAQADYSWGYAMEEIVSDAGGKTLRLGELDRSTEAAALTSDLMEEEIGALNAEFRLPHRVTVNVTPCGEANAYYDPADRSITMCSEFAAALAEQF